MNNDELATRRAQAIAEEAGVSRKDVCAMNSELKPAPVLSRLVGCKERFW